MINFPNAKINLGLRILEKRNDGYHNIETIFYPVGWCDVLEALNRKGEREMRLNLSGIPVPGRSGNENLCVKLYNILKTDFPLTGLDVWLHKTIPIGAGLGGGSSDAAYFMKLLNSMFNLKLTVEKMKEYVSQVGSDCAFFIENKPALATGKGDVIEPLKMDLSALFVAIVYPEILISTAEAYRHAEPYSEGESLKKIVTGQDIGKWKDNLTNDFEAPIIKMHPGIGDIKKKLYDNGAIYASMTGSGSAVYGIFEKQPDPASLFPSFKTWKGKLTKPQ